MYNKITLMGRLCAAPEMKTTQNGITYARFRIAVNRRFHSKKRRKQGRFLQCNCLERYCGVYLQVFRQGQYDYARR